MTRGAIDQSAEFISLLSVVNGRLSPRARYSLIRSISLGFGYRFKSVKSFRVSHQNVETRTFVSDPRGQQIEKQGIIRGRGVARMRPVASPDEALWRRSDKVLCHRR